MSTTQKSPKRVATSESAMKDEAAKTGNGGEVGDAADDAIRAAEREIEEPVEQTPDEAAEEYTVGGAMEVHEPSREIVRFANQERELIAKTIMPGASAAELSLFEKVCIRTQLDPFARQIYAIKRFQKGRGEVWSFQTSIDGFRLVAQRSSAYAGQTPMQWCGPDGNWKDVWLVTEPPAAARVGVHRHGFAEPLMRTVTWADFAPKDLSKAPMWRNMGAFMLAKCAESQALRAAFPQELSGLYTSEEMAQAQTEATWENEHAAGIGAAPYIEAAPSVPVPKGWAELRALVASYGEQAWEDFREFMAQASNELFGTDDATTLDRAQRDTLWQKSVSATMHLADDFDPGAFPPPARSAFQAAWAGPMGGVVLEGPPWKMSPEEDLPTREEHIKGEAALSSVEEESAEGAQDASGAAETAGDGAAESE
jgi:phage recombination protein Bet